MNAVQVQLSRAGQTTPSTLEAAGTYRDIQVSDDGTVDLATATGTYRAIVLRDGTVALLTYTGTKATSKNEVTVSRAGQSIPT